MSKKVFKAIIPAAGKGMRMRPLTSVLPKEMFPLGRKPMIQLAVEEAITAEIPEVCIVIRKGKEIIKDYFLSEALHNSDSVVGRRLHSSILNFVYQNRWDGLGGALRAARRFVGNDPFLMIIPDQMLSSQGTPASQQLLSLYEVDQSAVLSSVVKIPDKEVKYFHGARGFVLDAEELRHNRVFPVSRIVSGAKIHQSFAHARFEVRGFGRTIFPPTIFPYLTPRFMNPKTGEIDLWRTFKEFPKKIPHFGCLLKGRACDLGSLAGYYRYLPLFSRDL